MTGVLVVAAALAAAVVWWFRAARHLDRGWTDWTLRPDELHDNGSDR